jgi:hypothetical protein
MPERLDEATYPDDRTVRALVAGPDCGPYTALVRAMAAELMAARAALRCPARAGYEHFCAACQHYIKPRP